MPPELDLFRSHNRFAEPARNVPFNLFSPIAEVRCPRSPANQHIARAMQLVRIFNSDTIRDKFLL